MLFRIDPTPYQLDVAKLEAQLAQRAGRTARDARRRSTGAGAQGGRKRAARSRRPARSIAEVDAKLELARKRVAQNRELVRRPAPAAASTSSRPRPNARRARRPARGRAQRQAQARGGEAQALASAAAGASRSSAPRSTATYAQVAQIRAQLENARWQLDQTTTRLALRRLRHQPAAAAGRVRRGLAGHAGDDAGRGRRPGGRALQPERAHQVEPGDEAEFALADAIRASIIKGKVDSIIWAQGRARCRRAARCRCRRSPTQPPGRFAVKFDVAERDRELFLAAGAAGRRRDLHRARASSCTSCAR